MYEIAICDDDRAFMSELEALLHELLSERKTDCHVTQFSDPSALLAAIEQGMCCDLLFQDIFFGQEKGLRCAQILRDQNYDVDLVFVTTSRDYAVDAYSVQPLHYLLKPLSRTELSRALNRFLQQHTPQVLCLTTPQGAFRVPMTDALYFEIYNHTIVVHLSDGGSRSWRGSLQELEAVLPSDQFVRTHRSFLVNLEHISEIGHNQILLTTGDTLPVSRNALANVRMSLLSFDRRRHLFH